jgi:hypothetical protein
LKHERLMVGNPARSEALFRSITKLAESTMVEGRPALDSREVRQRLASLEAWLETQRCSGFYQTTKALKDEPAGTIGLTNKLSNTNFGQRVAELALDLIGDGALVAPNVRPVNIPRRGGHGSCCEQVSLVGLLELVW